MLPQIICLMGPTASGKTQLAIDLVERFPLEIISVDSALVYRGMDIGTAKPSLDMLKIAPHRLIDMLDPSVSYSAAQFVNDARREIDNIHQAGKIPLLVGGTMLYFRALQKGLSALPSADPELRASITREAEESGWPSLHAKLARIDSISASRIHPHDAQRIQRALEIFYLTGESRTQLQTQHLHETHYEFLNLAIAPTDRKILHQRIEKRFMQMLADGFIDEVKKLYDRGDLTQDMSAIRSVGYRQVWEYFQEQLTYEQMIAKGIIATRQFAKRQLTWLRHWPQPVIWFDSLDENLKSKVGLVLQSFLRPL